MRGVAEKLNMLLEDFGPARGDETAAHIIKEAVTAIEAAHQLKAALHEMISIVEIHSKATGRNFAWAELPEARSAIALADEAL